MGISGFTFVHNAVDSGYPIVEAINCVVQFVDEMVVVDMESTDETPKLLDNLRSYGFIDRVLKGNWQPGQGGRCLAENHSLNELCSHETIFHFEADEIFDSVLAAQIAANVKQGIKDIAVWRIQVEQNFQRVRWYPTPVHRVFPRGSVIKDGETTDVHRHGKRLVKCLDPKFGFLWDVTNCFRDNWIPRAKKNHELWGGRLEFKYEPFHMAIGMEIVDEQGAKEYMKEPHWTWTASPFKMPEDLDILVGTISYSDTLTVY